MNRRLRVLSKVNYSEPNLTDHYGTFPPFIINPNQCYIACLSDEGLLIAGSATYPYFVNNICWVKFIPNNHDFYYFEKQIYELKEINGIEEYFKWVKSKYKYLLPYYRDALMKQIPIQFKYSSGDIVFMNDDNQISQIIDGKYDIETDHIVYNVRMIDLNRNSLITLKHCHNVMQDNLKMGISALDCFSKFNNDSLAIQAHALYVREQLQCSLHVQRYDVLKQMCLESCENILQVIADKFVVWIQSRNFVHEYRSASAPITKNMFIAIMMKYLWDEYHLPLDVWKYGKRKIKPKTALSLNVTASIFGVDVISNTVNSKDIDDSDNCNNKNNYGWKVFIAEPIIVWEDNEISLMAHICDTNPTTGFINGDPSKKRERLRKYNQLKKEARKFYKKLVLAFIRQETHRFGITADWINKCVIQFFGIHKIKAYRNYCLTTGNESRLSST